MGEGKACRRLMLKVRYSGDKYEIHILYRTTKGYRIQLFILFLSVISSTVTGALFPYAIGGIADQIFYEQQMKGFLLWFFLYAGLYLLNQSLHGVLNSIWTQLEVTYVVSILNL